MMRQFQTTSGLCNGNGTCDPGEDCASCADCGQVSGAFCGNGLCEAGDGENCVTCAADCAGKLKGKTPFCCGADTGDETIANIGCGVDANDNRCIDSSSNVYCRMTARLSACCGDALCEGAETESSCANDCGGTSCEPTESSEVSCFDVSDNDCDGQVDCADNDCNSVTEPNTCGVGVCASSGERTCQSGDLSDSCTPLPATEPGTEVTCDNGLDDDCDGLADSADPDCGGGETCGDILDKATCNNDSTCTWEGSPKNGTCVGNVACVPDETPEVTCTDGADNDCNGATDCADANCSGDPACQATCNNDGICDPGEDCLGCANDCSGVTGGKPANRYCCGNGVEEGSEGDGTICNGNF